MELKKNLVVLKSTEIPDNVWEEIAQGYNCCFGGDRTGDLCKKNFQKGILGYCLHGLKFNEKGNLVGHIYFQPIPYKFNNKDLIIALSGGVFVLPHARKDAFIYQDLFKEVSKVAKLLEWKAIFGVPNENSFKYTKKILKQKHIADLNYYILPVRAGKALKKNIPLINSLSRLFVSLSSSLNLGISSLFNSKQSEKPLLLPNEYKDHRLSKKTYKKYSKGNCSGSFRMYDENGVNTAYIMDFREGEKKSAKALAKLVRNIIKSEKNVDAILYVGTMDLKQTSLIKVPHKLVPHQLHLCTSVFDKNDKELADALSSIDNIDFGLVNFDVR